MLLQVQQVEMLTSVFYYDDFVETNVVVFTERNSQFVYIQSNKRGHVTSIVEIMSSSSSYC